MQHCEYRNNNYVHSSPFKYRQPYLVKSVVSYTLMPEDGIMTASRPFTNNLSSARALLFPETLLVSQGPREHAVTECVPCIKALIGTFIHMGLLSDSLNRQW